MIKAKSPQKPPLSAREAALMILFKVENEGAYANLEAAKILDGNQLSDPDKRLAREIVYGVLSRRAALDHILAKLLTKPLSGLPLWILLILRLSLYQLMFLERIPQSAAVNEGVKLSKKFGHQGTAALVNAVLRNYLRKKSALQLPALADGIEEYLSVTLSHPRWLTEYLLEKWPVDDIIAFYRYNNQSRGLTVRANTLKISRAELIQALQSEGLEAIPGGFAPESILLPHAGGIFESKLYQSGLFQVQDESSMLAAHILAPLPGSVVMDLCAAPGGKTTHLAQLMKNNGRILAFDIHRHKAALIKANCDRLGIEIVEAITADAAALSREYDGLADYLLLDAPCSGLGVLGRRPDLRWRKDKKDIAAMAEIAGKLLLRAADYLKPGGILCFCTCTVTKEENDDTVDWFLKERPDFAPSPFERLLPYQAKIADIKAAAGGRLQLLPQTHGLDGFFLSRLLKKGERL